MDQSKEKFAQLQELIDSHRNQPGALMPVLQGAQGIFGCVSEDVQKFIAEGLGVTLSEVYGVATFYAQFSLHPKGEYLISVCLGTACYVKGSQALIDRAIDLTGAQINKTSDDGLFSLDATRCLGACGLAPVVVIDGRVVGSCTPQKLEAEIKALAEAEKAELRA